MKPDGGEIFVPNFKADTLSAVNTSANEISESFVAGDNPDHVLVNGSNTLIFVSNFGSNSVTVFDITTRKFVVAVPTGKGPDALALNSMETMLLVANSGSGDVAVIRLDKRVNKKSQGLPTPRLFTMIPTGERPNSIVIKSPKAQ
jgi:YVTN family beta-propeller protein